MLDKSARAKREYEDARKHTPERMMYSTPAWRKLRAMVLREESECATPGCIHPARVVDHIRPHRGDPALFFDRANLQALCKRCHDQKTAKLDGGFGNESRSSVTGSVADDASSIFVV
jgi:5-methylcytosine-specific restriction protein A